MSEIMKLCESDRRLWSDLERSSSQTATDD